MKRIYISGLISTDQTEQQIMLNIAKFNRKAKELESRGYEVVNPATFDVEGKSNAGIMKACLDAQISCSIVYFLNNYKLSNGAMMEYYFAKMNKQEMLFEEQSTLEEISKHVCATEGITLQELKGNSRKRKYVEARMMFSYFARKNTNCGFIEIGKFINLDHSTCIYHIRTINAVKELREKVERYKNNAV